MAYGAYGGTFNRWRQVLWSKIEGTRILEVGVGSGQTFPFYPLRPGYRITAIDNNAAKLSRARREAEKSGLRVELALMDVQHMDFPDNTFDTVVSSMTFCRVKDPVLGLKEVKRVVRSGGKVVMLEHVISDKKWQARLMGITGPLIFRLTGEDINRHTVRNIEYSGLIIEKVARLNSIFRLIEARKERIYMLQ